MIYSGFNQIWKQKLPIPVNFNFNKISRGAVEHEVLKIVRLTGFFVLSYSMLNFKDFTSIQEYTLLQISFTFLYLKSIKISFIIIH